MSKQAMLQNSNKANPQKHRKEWLSHIRQVSNKDSENQANRIVKDGLDSNSMMKKRLQSWWPTRVRHF